MKYRMASVRSNEATLLRKVKVAGGGGGEGRGKGRKAKVFMPANNDQRAR